MPSSSSSADFSPALIRIQERPASPLAGWTLRMSAAVLAAALLWAAFARLDVVAVAQGKLVPAAHLKIVQAAEQGIVREILVREGQAVKEGEVLARMDPSFTAADMKTLASEAESKSLALRRIDAQLAGRPVVREPGDTPAAFGAAEAQYRANVEAHANAIAQERSVLDKARHDLAAARETRAKLEQVLPHYREQEAAFEKLSREGFAGRIMVADKQRERIEKEQDLRSQDFVIRSNLALIEQSERRIAQISSDYRRQLQAERAQIAPESERARQELAKHVHREGLLELHAPVDGVVKELATHTAGTVAAPGTILMTIVPADGQLVAEVWTGNEDVGFVRPGLPARLKLAPFQFQKYGMVDATVEHVSADASDAPGRERPSGQLAFRTLVKPATAVLKADGVDHALVPGMQVSAEIRLGSRTVLEYLLSPALKVFHEAARER